MTNTLWLVVGRGGSKGVPGKNLKIIGGKSLVEWKIRAARAADPSAFVVCSSDCHDILLAAQDAGASYLIPRPSELASDTATSADVIRHALDCLTAGGRNFERVVLLEPSAPFTRGEHYKVALNMMEFEDADLVVGMRYTDPHPVFIGDVRDDRSVTPIIVNFQRQARRRQDHPQTWSMNGALYIFKTDMFLKTGDIYGGSRSYGLLMDRFSSIEIDHPHDLDFAEMAYEKGYVKPEGS